MVSIVYLFLIGSIVCAIVGAVGKGPWWGFIAFVLLWLVVALQVFPIVR